MKTFFAVATTLAAALAPLASAQSVSSPSVSPTAAAFLAQFDQAKTGAVSWDAFERFRQQRYEATDANHDGAVDRQEYVAEYLQRFDVRLADARAGHLRQTDTRFKALDRD